MFRMMLSCHFSPLLGLVHSLKPIHVLSRNEVRSLIFCIFLKVRRTIILKLFGSKEGVIRVSNVSRPQICLGKEIFFL